jgi:hypothetical protein
MIVFALRKVGLGRLVAAFPARNCKGAIQLMLITIRKAPSRAKRIEVDILPAEWQIYIAH